MDTLRGEIPDDSERQGNAKVEQDVPWTGPSSSNEFTQRRAARTREGPHVIEEKPVQYQSAQVYADRSPMLCRQARTGHRPSLQLGTGRKREQQNHDEHRGVPRRSQEAAPRWTFPFDGCSVHRIPSQDLRLCLRRFSCAARLAKLPVPAATLGGPR